MKLKLLLFIKLKVESHVIAFVIFPPEIVKSPPIVTFPPIEDTFAKVSIAASIVASVVASNTSIFFNVAVPPESLI